MPAIDFFAYKAANRRSDMPVVEVLLTFDSEDVDRFPRKTSQIRDLLISSGILAAGEVFPQVDLPDESMAWYTSLLLQTALLFQQKAGHRVSYFSVSALPERNQCLALLEHEHCDVGMTAVKLASELLTGKRKLLAEPFRMYSKFARDRLLPVVTEAIIKAAQRRDIPAIQLERSPFKREDFDEITGGRSICPNGLLMLGHGRHQLVLDGTYCIDRAEDFAPLFATEGNQATVGADLETAADTLLGQLFPSDKSVNMPIIAITGTNGKTTTTRMIGHIMSATKRKTGMVCTDGVFLNDRMLLKGDQSARIGHMKVLCSKEVDFAILETHHKGMLHEGFAFNWCDIAVCLNVTEDHLGDGSIKTVEDMAEIKSSLPERARESVVLNADNSYCLAMLDKVTAKNKCLVSMQSSRDQLIGGPGNVVSSCCVLEMVGGLQCVVIYDGELRIPVMPVNSIPATIDGAARFNVSNAMHAIVASYLSGVDIEVTKTAMSSFRSSYEQTPGRLNVFDDLPFRIIMDFAHNPDGMRSICEFVDQLEVSGRKRVAFAATINRTDETIRQMARAIAGHFDFYFCKEHLRVDGKQPRTVAHLLQQGLIESGIAESQIAVTYHGKEVVFEIFDACKPGDLLVMLLGHVEKHQVPDYIREYAGLNNVKSNRP